MLFFQDETAHTRDYESDQNFDQIIPGGRFAPAMDELAKPFAEEREDGEHCATLNDDIEEVGLVGKPAFRYQEMAGGGDGKEFGNPFNNAEQNDSEPNR